MKIAFASPRKVHQFATIFANLKNFTDNVCLYFKPTGLYIQCMDGSHCCLFECNLGSDWFEIYEYDEAKDQSCIGLNIIMMNKVLGTWNEKQSFTMLLNNGCDKISINFENDADDKVPNEQFDKFFELPLITIDNELMAVEAFETTVDLTVDSILFCSLIKSLVIFNEDLTLTFNEENIECVSSGSDGSMKALITADDVKEYAISEDTTFKQSYSLRYVQTMCSFNKLAPEMKMGFGGTMPMVMKYVLSDTEDEHESFVSLHLAPKLVDEEEQDEY